MAKQSLTRIIIKSTTKHLSRIDDKYKNRPFIRKVISDQKIYSKLMQNVHSSSLLIV